MSVVETTQPMHINANSSPNVLGMYLQTDKKTVSGRFVSFGTCLIMDPNKSWTCLATDNVSDAR